MLFMQAGMTLTQSGNYHWGEFQGATLRLEHADTPELLKAVQLSHPHIEGDQARKYALFGHIFWAVILPDGISPRSRIEAWLEAVQKTGRYSESIGDVSVTVTRMGNQTIYFAEENRVTTFHEMLKAVG